MADYKVAEAYAVITGKDIGFKSMLDNAKRDTDKAVVQINETLSKIGKGMTSVGTKLMVGITLPIVAIGKHMLDLGMKSIEGENLFNRSFGSMAEAAGRWADAFSSAMGRSKFQVRENMGLLNTMMGSMGLTEQQSYQMSQGLTKLAYDMASYYQGMGLTASDAFEKIRSGMVGMSRPLMELGLNLHETAVQEYAWAHGIAENGKQLTETQKVLARYGLLMQITSKAQGDLARTMNSPMNRTERLKAQISALETEIGKKLIPTYQKLLTEVEKMLKWWNKLPEATQETIIKDLALAAAIGPVLIGLGAMFRALGQIVFVITKIPKAIELAKVSITGLKSAFETLALRGMYAVDAIKAFIAVCQSEGIVAAFSGVLAGLSAVVIPIAIGVAAVTAEIWLFIRAINGQKEAIDELDKKLAKVPANVQKWNDAHTQKALAGSSDQGLQNRLNMVNEQIRDTIGKAEDAKSRQSFWHPEAKRDLDEATREYQRLRQMRIAIYAEIDKRKKPAITPTAPTTPEVSSDELDALDKIHAHKLALQGKEDEAKRAEIEAEYHSELRNLDELAKKGQDITNRKKEAELSYREQIMDLDNEIHERKVKQIEDENKKRNEAIRDQRDTAYGIMSGSMDYIIGGDNPTQSVQARKYKAWLEYRQKMEQDAASGKTNPIYGAAAYSDYQYKIAGIDRDEQRRKDEIADREKEAASQSKVIWATMYSGANAGRLAQIETAYKKEMDELDKLAAKGEEVAERRKSAELKRASEIQQVNKQIHDDAISKLEQEIEKRKSAVRWGSLEDMSKNGLVAGIQSGITQQLTASQIVSSSSNSKDWTTEEKRALIDAMRQIAQYSKSNLQAIETLTRK